jgi:hypothetical protein
MKNSTNKSRPSGKTIFRKMLALLLCFCMVASFAAPFQAFAEEGEVSIDLAEIPAESTSGDGWRYTKAEPSYYTIEPGANVSVTGEIADDTYILVAPGASTLKLSDASITTNFENTSAVKLQSGASLSLILAGRNVLDASANNDCAGLEVPVGAAVTISGVGSLTAKGGYQAAGIGGAHASAGTITINDGTILAYSTAEGAGIGGGLGGNGGRITINGGTVNAYGANGTAGIGGGGGGDYEGDGGEITITGGTIYAIGGKSAAGIGGGALGDGGTVTISGGVVTAVGGAVIQMDWTVGADIGSGGTSAKWGEIPGGTLAVSGGATLVLDANGTTASAPTGGVMFSNCTVMGAGAGDLAGSYNEYGGESGVFHTVAVYDDRGYHVGTLSVADGATIALADITALAEFPAYATLDTANIMFDTNGDNIWTTQDVLNGLADMESLLGTSQYTMQFGKTRITEDKVIVFKYSQSNPIVEIWNALEIPNVYVGRMMTKGADGYLYQGDILNMPKVKAQYNFVSTNFYGPGDIPGLGGMYQFINSVLPAYDLLAGNSEGFSFGDGDEIFIALSYKSSPTFASAIAVNKDGSAWEGNNRPLSLRQDGEIKADNQVPATAVAFGALPNGTYDIFDGETDTGKDMVISDDYGYQTLDYYTITFSASKAGTGNTPSVSATYNDEPIASGDAVIRGGKLVVTVAPSGAESYAYTWIRNGIERVNRSPVFTLYDVDAAQSFSCTVTGTGAAPAPAPQTQGLFLDTTSGKLELGSTDGEEALPDVNFTGEYAYANGVLTLTDFTFSTSANHALTIPEDSALTQIAFSGDNSITSTAVNTGDAQTAGILYSGTNTITFSNADVTAVGGSDSGTLTLTGGTTSAGTISAGILFFLANAEVSSGTLVCVGGDAEYWSYGITTSGRITVSGGTLIGRSGTGLISVAFSNTDGITVPESNYQFRTTADSAWTAITDSPLGRRGQSYDTTTHYLEIAPVIEPQTQGLFLDTTSGKLELGSTDGEEALPGVNFMGDYAYASGVLTLTDFTFSTSASVALTIPGDSALTEIAFSGENSITSTATVSDTDTKGLSHAGANAITFSGADDGTLTLTGGTATDSASSYGIHFAQMDGTLRSGTLVCVGGDAGELSIGMQPSTGFTVSGGTLICRSGTGTTSRAYRNFMTVPASAYRYRTAADGAWTAITMSRLGIGGQSYDSLSHYLEIAPMVPDPQTQGLVLDSNSGKLELGSTDGAEALPGVNFTGEYAYANGVLTLTDFTFSTSANLALTIPDDSALTEIAFSGDNSITSTATASEYDVTVGLSYTGTNTITFSGADDGTMTLTAGSASDGARSYGLDSWASLVLRSGTLVCVARDAEVWSRGISAVAALTVSGGTLICQSGTGTMSSALSVGPDGTSVPASGYQFRTAADGAWTAITQNTLGGILGQLYDERTHYLEIAPAPSADATLSALTIDAGTLSPAFDSATDAYFATVDNGVTSVTISATANHAEAAVSGDVGTKALSVGDNTFTITVTAQDGTTKAYTLVVTRTGPSYYSALVVYKDYTMWRPADSGKSFYLKNDATNLTYGMTAGTSSYYLYVPNGVYSVYEDAQTDVDTGVNIEVNNTSGAQNLYYFTATFGASQAGHGTQPGIRATYDGAEIASGEALLPGGTLVVSATGAGAVFYDYAWTNDAADEDEVAATYTINELRAAVSTQCTVTGSGYVPEPQTQGIFLNTDDGLLHLGSKTGAEALPNVNFTGSYFYEDGVLTLEDFHYACSTNGAVATFTGASALVFNGTNVIKEIGGSGYSVALRIYDDVVLSSEDNGTLTLLTSNVPYDSKAFIGDNITLASGTLICNAGSGYWSHGIMAMNFTMTGGELRIANGTATQDNYAPMTTHPMMSMDPGQLPWEMPVENSIIVPESGYKVRTEPDGDFTMLTESVYVVEQNTTYLEIVFAVPDPQTQGLVLDTTSGKLELGSTDGEEALPGVNFTGKYAYKNGVLTLDNFQFSTSADIALTIPEDSALTEIAFSGDNSITSTASLSASGYTAGLRYSGVKTITFSGEDDAALTLTGGTASVTARSYGIRFTHSANIVLSSGTLVCVGGDATLWSTGLQMDGTFTLSGGTLICQSGEGAASYTFPTVLGITVPASHYQFRTAADGAWTKITQSTLGGISGQSFDENSRYLEIAEVPNNAPEAKPETLTAYVKVGETRSVKASDLAKDADGDQLEILEISTDDDDWEDYVQIDPSFTEDGLLEGFTVQAVGVGEMELTVYLSDGWGGQAQVPLSIVSYEENEEILTKDDFVRESNTNATMYFTTHVQTNGIWYAVAEDGEQPLAWQSISEVAEEAKAHEHDISSLTMGNKDVWVMAADQSGNRQMIMFDAGTPAIAWPSSGSAITYGAALSTSALTDNDENGTFAWMSGNIIPTVAGAQIGYFVTYTPSNTDVYDYTGVTLTKAIPLTVNPKTLSPAFGEITKVYDGSDTINVGEDLITFSGNLAGDDVYLTGFGVFAGGSDVTPSGATKNLWIDLTLGGEDKGNYQVESTVLTTGSITKRTVSVELGTISKAFDNTNAVKFQSGYPKLSAASGSTGLLAVDADKVLLVKPTATYASVGTPEEDTEDIAVNFGGLFTITKGSHVDNNSGNYTLDLSSVFNAQNESIVTGDITEGFDAVEGVHYQYLESYGDGLTFDPYDNNGAEKWVTESYHFFAINKIGNNKVGFTLASINFNSCSFGDDDSPAEGATSSFYVKNAAGEISKKITVRYFKDATAPTGTIRFADNGWTEFLNTVTFGFFFKETVDVTVTASDAASGIAKTEYLLSETKFQTEQQAITAGGWTVGDSFSIEPNYKGYVYARITDVAGNVSIINSDGVVVYTDAAAVTESISFTKTSTEDVPATVALNGNTVDKIMNGAQTLGKDTDYTVSGSVITFKASYLDSLAANSYTLTVYYNPLGETYVEEDGNDAPATTTIALTVSKSTNPPAIVWPSSGSAITYGAALSTSTLTDNDPNGSFAWTSGATIPTVEGGTAGYSVTYTPSNTDAYDYAGVTLTKTIPLTVHPKLLTAASDITFMVAGKVYDGTTTASFAVSPQFKADVILSGDEVSLATSSAAFRNSDADPTPPTDNVDVTIRLSGEDSRNYTFTSQTSDLETVRPARAAITKRLVQVELGTITKGFDNTNTVKYQSGYPRLEAALGNRGLIAADANKVSLVQPIATYASVGNVEEDTAGIKINFDGLFSITKGSDSDDNSGNYQLNLTNIYNVPSVYTTSKITGTITEGFDAVEGVHYELYKQVDGEKNEYNGEWLKGGYTFLIEKVGNNAVGYNFTQFGGSPVAWAETPAEGKEISFYVKNADGEISKMKTVKYFLDQTAPTAELQIGTNAWKSFLNSITFGVFFKDTEDVKIADVRDSISGIKSIAYWKDTSGESYTSAELALAADWESTESLSAQTLFTAEPNEKFVVYVKITDNADNVTYLSSDGVVVYTDSAAVTESISFTKTSAEDVLATVALNGNTVDKIMNGAQTLVKDTDYTVSGSTITFKASYLDSLAANSYTLTVYYNPLGETYVEEDGNDAPATTTIALTVQKADISAHITLSDASGVYNGKQHALTAGLTVPSDTVDLQINAVANPQMLLANLNLFPLNLLLSDEAIADLTNILSGNGSFPYICMTGLPQGVTYLYVIEMAFFTAAPDGIEFAFVPSAAQSATASDYEDGSFTYTYVGADGTDYGTAQPILPGTYTVTASYASDSYEGTATATLTIEKADPSLALTAAPADGAGKYGDKVVLTATVAQNGEGDLPTGSVTFKQDGEVLAENVALVSGEAACEVENLAVQDYTFTVEYSGDSKYTTDSAEIADFNLEKADQSAVSIENPGTITYGDTGLVLSATGGSGTGEYVFSVPANSYLDVDSTGNVTVKAATNGETVTVSVYRAADESYLQSAAASIDLTVERLAIAAPTVNAPIYNGETQEGVSGDEIGYSFSGETTGVDAGDYSATATLDDNHKWSDESTDALTLNWTIAKLAIDMPTLPGDTLTYNGAIQIVLADGVGYTVSEGAAKNAGNYTAVVTLDGNHKWSDDSTENLELPWEIQAFAITVTAQDTSKYFGAEDPELTFVVEPALFEGDALTGSLQYVGTNVGTYDIVEATPFANSNYAITFVKGTMTILQTPSMEEVIALIDALPNPVTTWAEADEVAAVTNLYAALPLEEQAQIPQDVLDKLTQAQEQADAVNKSDTEASVTGELPWNVRLEVTPVSDTAAFARKLPQGKDLLALFEIRLIDTLTGEEYVLAASQSVSVTLQQSTSGKQGVVLYHEKADGSVERIAASVKGDTVTFSAKDFSLYGVAADQPKNDDGAPTTGDESNLPLWIALLALSIAGLTALAFGKRKSRKKR